MAEIAVMPHPSLRVAVLGCTRSSRIGLQLVRGNRLALRSGTRLGFGVGPRLLKRSHRVDHRGRNVRHGPKTVSVGEQFLGDGDHTWALVYQKADRANQVVGAAVVGARLVEVEPRV